MNFPMEYPIFGLLYWIVNTPGAGSLILFVIFMMAIGLYTVGLRKIVKTGRADHPGLSAPAETYHP